jgi:hypothetical protein
MPILLKEPFNEYASLLYHGSRSRYATVTDVRFLNSNKILVGHRYACKLYILEYLDSWKILSTYELFWKKRRQIEMFDIVGSTIYLISYESLLFILNIDGNNITLQKVVQLNSLSTPYHGIQWHEGAVWITPSSPAGVPSDDHIVQYIAETGAIIKTPPPEKDIRIKDIGFLPGDYYLLLINPKQKIRMTTKGYCVNGRISIYDSKWNLVFSQVFPDTHFDAVATQGDTFYVTASDLRGGWIITGDVIDGKIKGLREIAVDDFPHGINLCDSKIAYTSYGTSSVHILDIGAFFFFWGFPIRLTTLGGHIFS